MMLELMQSVAIVMIGLGLILNVLLVQRMIKMLVSVQKMQVLLMVSL